MPSIDFGAALRMARSSDPSGVADVVAVAAQGIGATDVVVYLVDFGQTTLQPLRDRSAHADLAEGELVSTTMAGRAFTDQRVVSAARDVGVRGWAPIMEGSDRTGVLAMTVPKATARALRSCEELGLLAGYFIAAQARCTDTYNLYRRRHRMGLAASMQWDLLPPLVLKTDTVSVAGVVEPAYDVGGDCFDYAANGPVCDFAILDAMGHGVGSAMVSGLALGCYRRDRREGQPLEAIHSSIGAIIHRQYQERSFSTGLLGRLAVDTGVLTWTNAGHPLPLLVRGGNVVRELQCAPTPPWGIVGRDPVASTEQLEPGDSLLLYTDGVTEARLPDGEEFGIERFIDLIDRSSSDLLPPETVVRNLVHSIRDHQDNEAVDDASIVMIRWEG